jgi:hypothetical protein
VGPSCRGGECALLHLFYCDPEIVFCSIVLKHEKSFFQLGKVLLVNFLSLDGL